MWLSTFRPARVARSPLAGDPPDPLRLILPHDRLRWKLPHHGGVQTLRPVLRLVLHLLPLSEGPEPLTLDCRVVNEHVPAIRVGDEPVPLRVVEPLHLSNRHPYSLLSSARVRHPSVVAPRTRRMRASC